MEFLKNPIILGGVMPMIGFGLYDVFWGKLSSQFSLPELFLAVATAATISAIALFIFGDFSSSHLGTLVWWKAVLTCFLWVFAVAGLTFGFMYGGTVSSMIPIVHANVLIAVAFAVLVMGETITWNMGIGAVMVAGGAALVVMK